MDLIINIAVFLIAAVIFTFVGMFLRKKTAEAKLKGAENEAQRIIEMANKEKIDHLLPELHLEKPESSTENQNLAGLSFVVTGTLNSFENRNALKEEIEKRGGKVTGSVTSKTECLINNDVTSSSSKNKKAKELNVPIL